MSDIEILRNQKRELERRMISLDAEIRDENLKILSKRFGRDSNTEINLEFLVENLPEIVHNIKVKNTINFCDNLCHSIRYGFEGEMDVDTIEHFIDNFLENYVELMKKGRE